MSPGVAHPQAYAALAPLFQNEFRRLGVPLVNQAPGVDLDDDGIHWRVTSRHVVETLFGSLVQAAVDTKKFHHGTPPTLWNWRWNTSAGKHFPCCMVCDRDASDDHLFCRKHQEKSGGTSKLHISFHFAKRHEYMENGVRFYDIHGKQDKSPYLPANTPISPANFNDAHKMATVKIASFAIEQSNEQYAPRSPNCGLSKDCCVHLTWTDQCDQLFEFKERFEFEAAGKARDAFSSLKSNLILKIQDLSVPDRNHQEWLAYQQSPAIRKIVPQVYGYTIHEIDGKRMSFLLVERIAQTFARMYEKHIIVPIQSVPLERVLNHVMILAPP